MGAYRGRSRTGPCEPLWLCETVCVCVFEAVGCGCRRARYDGVVVRSRSLLSPGRGRFGPAELRTAKQDGTSRAIAREEAASTSLRQGQRSHVHPRGFNFDLCPPSCDPIHSLAHDQTLARLKHRSATISSTSIPKSIHPGTLRASHSLWQKSAVSAPWTAMPPLHLARSCVPRSCLSPRRSARLSTTSRILSARRDTTTASVRTCWRSSKPVYVPCSLCFLRPRLIYIPSLPKPTF